MRSTKKLAVLTAGIVALAAAPAVAGAPPSPSAAARKVPRLKVQVADDYFSPAKNVVKRGTKVTWIWGDLSRSIHDVELLSAPKGVRHFHSQFGSIGFRYSQHLTKPGKYRFICTLHAAGGMQMRITVRR
jgi:plastocyanin